MFDCDNQNECGGCDAYETCHHRGTDWGNIFIAIIFIISMLSLGMLTVSCGGGDGAGEYKYEAAVNTPEVENDCDNTTCDK